MVKKKVARELSFGEEFKNDVLFRKLNVFLGLPEDFKSNIEDLSEMELKAIKIFGAKEAIKI